MYMVTLYDWIYYLATLIPEHLVYTKNNAARLGINGMYMVTLYDYVRLGLLFGNTDSRTFNLH